MMRNCPFTRDFSSCTGINTKPERLHQYLLFQIWHTYEERIDDCIVQNILPLGFLLQLLIIIGIYDVTKPYVNSPAQEKLSPCSRICPHGSAGGSEEERSTVKT